MFERPETGERAILVHLTLRSHPGDLAEFQELVKSAGAEIMAVIVGNRPSPDPKYFVGTGKLEEIKTAIALHEADIVLFDHVLSPSQERNLEQALEVRVTDRNSLILDIFAQRAQSFEGKLQVELAQLKHLSTRLIRGWTHLERQKGGIGLRGPGETQLETDRRLIDVRMDLIQRRLEKVAKQRHQSRSQRKKAEIPALSLVGYTNAGKSTLFNQLSGAEVYVADQLFATLDPTLRSLALTDSTQLIVADTVGFINHLPHELVAAFHSTLQEACEADLLLHVLDASPSDASEKIVQVNQVLQQIGAEKIPQLQIFNKIDKMPEVVPHIDRDAQGIPQRVWLSAQTGAGLDLLRQALIELFAHTKVRIKCQLSANQGSIYARLFPVVKILEERMNEQGDRMLTFEMDKKHLGLLKAVSSYQLESNTQIE